MWTHFVQSAHSLVCFHQTSMVAQMVKRLCTTQETQVQSLDLEDPLEKDMTTHSSTLAWKIPRMEERCRLQSMGSQRVGTWLSDFTSSFFLSGLLAFEIPDSQRWPENKINIRHLASIQFSSALSICFGNSRIFLWDNSEQLQDGLFLASLNI